MNNHRLLAVSVFMVAATTNCARMLSPISACRKMIQEMSKCESVHLEKMKLIPVSDRLKGVIPLGNGTSYFPPLLELGMRHEYTNRVLALAMDKGAMDGPGQMILPSKCIEICNFVHSSLDAEGRHLKALQSEFGHLGGTTAVSNSLKNLGDVLTPEEKGQIIPLNEEYLSCLEELDALGQKYKPAIGKYPVSRQVGP